MFNRLSRFLKRSVDWHIYRVPTDEEMIDSWKNALLLKGNDILRGMICFTHFKSDDIIPGSAKREMRLKKNAVPIGLSQQPQRPRTEPSDDIGKDDCNDIQQESEVHVESSTQYSGSDLNCTKCETAQAELKHLRHEYLTMKTDLELKIFKLEDKCEKLVIQLKDKAKESKLVRRRLVDAKSSKEKLQKSLTEFRRENLLCKEVFDFVQVSFENFGFQLVFY